MATAPAEAPAFKGVSMIAVIQGLLDAQANVAMLLDRSGSSSPPMRRPRRRWVRRSPARLIGRNVFELLPPAVAASRREHFDRALASGRAQYLDDDRDGPADPQLTFSPFAARTAASRWWRSWRPTSPSGSRPRRR